MYKLPKVLLNSKSGNNFLIQIIKNNKIENIKH